MTSPQRPLLVLGLGNRLLSDDGFGLALLASLRRRYGHLRELEFVDGGTLGTALLGRLEGRRGLLILDAVSDRLPGRVLRVDDPLSRPAPHAIGGHGANASGLLAAALLTGDLPEHVVVVGAAPESLRTGIGLSPTLQAALPAALELAEAALAELRTRLEEERLCTS
jgi:hydrogenase maturation protease